MHAVTWQMQVMQARAAKPVDTVMDTMMGTMTDTISGDGDGELQQYAEATHDIQPQCRRV